MRAHHQPTSGAMAHAAPIPTGGSRAAAEPVRRVTSAHFGQLLLLGAVWGGAFLFLRIAAPEVGAVWTAEIRIAIGAMVLVSVAGRRTWAIARTDIRAFAVLGAVFSAIPFTLIAIAALTLPTGFGAVLNASTPLFTALFAVTWLGQRLSARMVAGLATGVVAVVVLVGWSPLEPGLGTILAVLAALGAALSYAFAGTFVRRRLPSVGGVELATAQLTAASIILLPVAIASGPPGSPSLGAVVALIAVGTLSTALPWPIYFRLLSATSPTIASTVTFIVPAFAMTWGAIVLGEPIGPGLLIGFGIVIVSLVLVLGVRLPVPARWSRVPVAVRAAS
jgi:drug/metabolite transporter (DMT)-like permease